MSKLLLITTPSLHDRDGDSFVVEVATFGVSNGVLWTREGFGDSDAWDEKHSTKETFYAPGAWLTAEEVKESEISYDESEVPVLND